MELETAAEELAPILRVLLANSPVVSYRYSCTGLAPAGEIAAQGRDAVPAYLDPAHLAEGCDGQEAYMSMSEYRFGTAIDRPASSRPTMKCRQLVLGQPAQDTP